MANNFKFVRDSGGFKALLQGAEAQACVKEYGNKALGRLPQGLYEGKSGVGRTRAYAVVHPANAKGYYTERKHGYAIKALKG